MRRLLLVGTLAGALLLAPVPVRSQWAVYDAANHVETLRTALQTYFAIVQRIEQIAQLYEQIETMYRNLESFDDIDWRQIRALLLRLDQLLAETDGLLYSMADLEARFAELFPGREPSETLREDYFERAHAGLETARGVLLFTRQLSIDNQESQWTVGTMRRQVLRAQGNLAAMQAQGMLLSYSAEEVSKNTHQLFVLTNLLAEEAAREVQDQLQGMETLDAMVQASLSTPPVYETGTTLPLVPASLGW